MARTSDLLAYLGAVVVENTQFYQSDFEYDKKQLRDALAEPKSEDRTFYWMSRPSGTWCVKEREAFLRDTGAYNIWTHYDTGNEGFKAYRVVVTGEENGRLTGELYPLNYAEQIKRVRANALPVHSVTGTYKDGTEFSMLFSEMCGIEAKMTEQRHGGIRTIRYEPESEIELSNRISYEHTLHKRPLRLSRKRRSPVR